MQLNQYTSYRHAKSALHALIDEVTEMLEAAPAPATAPAAAKEA